MDKSEVKIVSDDVEALLAEVIQDYETRTGKQLQPAHIERSILQSYAYRELLVRKGVNEAFLQTLPQFATGLMLDLCGEPMGCYRLENQPARCLIRFSVDGSHGDIVIPAHTVVAVNETISFETEIEITIDATVQYVDIPAVCLTTGTAGNGWQSGQIKTIKTAIPSNVSAANIIESSGGVETEDDDAYRKRILLAPEAFTTCGSIAAYEYHARSVSQYISDVSISTPQGGFVKVVVLTREGLPSQVLLDQVKEDLSAETKRPLCDTVLVEAPEVVEYQVNAQLSLFKGVVSLDVRKAAEASLNAYLASRYHSLGKDIVPMEIAQALKVEGVYNVTLQSPTLKRITKDQWSRCTAINITVVSEREDG